MQCENAKDIAKLKQKKPVKSGYVIMYNANFDKEFIRINLRHAMRFHKRKMSEGKIYYITEVLFAGQNKFDIDARDIIAIMSIESEFKIKAKGKNKKSTDYGLTQINSRNWNRLTKSSIKVLKEYSLPHGSRYNKYDIGINIMNCFVYFNWTKHATNYKRTRNKMRWIQSYNVGLAGSISKKRSYRVARKRYWQRFLKHRKRLFRR